MIENKVRSHLLNDSDIKDKLKENEHVTRLYPLWLPENTAYPAVAYRIISDISTYTLTEDTQRDQVRIQVSMFDKRDNYADLRELYYKIKDRMATLHDGEDAIQLAEFQEGETQYENDSEILHFSQDYLIYYDRSDLNGD